VIKYRIVAVVVARITQDGKHTDAMMNPIIEFQVTAAKRAQLQDARNQNVQMGYARLTMRNSFVLMSGDRNAERTMFYGKKKLSADQNRIFVRAVERRLAANT
jgi:hypothetical protein